MCSKHRHILQHQQPLCMSWSCSVPDGQLQCLKHDHAHWHELRSPSKPDHGAYLGCFKLLPAAFFCILNSCANLECVLSTAVICCC